jgi:hypothetical protein
MFRRLIFILVLGITAFGFYKIYNYYKHCKDYNPVLSGGIQPPVTVAARVGAYAINLLDGWTSPFAEVNLSSQGVVRKTLADENGYFAFYFVPITDNLSELCLVAQDVNQLPSFPVCLPPPPKNTDIQIRDVLLPPTLSLETGKIIAGETTKASGMAFPGAQIDVHLFTENDFSFWARIVKPLLAFSLPKYTLKANDNGYFEFSLPTSNPSKSRLFVTADSKEKGSPKSNTLAFEALGLWGAIKLSLANFLRQAIGFFKEISPGNFFIVLELAALFGLISLFFVHSNQVNPGGRKKRPA